MTKRELVIKVAEAYVEGYKRIRSINSVLSDFNIYIENESRDSALGRLENILNEVNDYIVDALLDYADCGCFRYWTGDREGEGDLITLSTVEDIIKDFVIE